jgi:hypothetical protein
MRRISRHRANGKKAARRLSKIGLRVRRLNARRERGPLIPDEVIEKLAALNLPPNPWVYSVCLRELLRGA